MHVRKLLVAVVAALCGSCCGVLLADDAALASTAAPQIERTWAAGVGVTGVSLYAQIVPDPETAPENSDTVYRFEYGTSTSYGTSVPVPDAAIKASTAAIEVFQPVSGLRPDTAYHYRVVAVNPSGETVGQDRVFTTFPVPASSDSCPDASVRSVQFSSYLPDCRAYELVSPPYDGKEGANVATTPWETQSSTDGNAIKFFARGSFGEDVIGSESLGGNEYIAERGSEGWLTHSIVPEQGSERTRLRSVTNYEATSPDLSKGVFFAFTPVVPGHPNVEHISNLYLRNDLLNSGPGSYELLNDAVSPITPSIKFGFIEPSEVWFAAASADWSHILFESNHDLTPEAEGLDTRRAKAYEWDKGTVRLVGILPDGKSAEESLPGDGVANIQFAGAWVGENAFEAVNGSRAAHSISADGSRVIFTGPPVGYYGSDSGPIVGNLYMRTDHSATIQLNVSERSEMDPNGPQPARFTAATVDDSKVLFVTTQALTNDAPVNSQSHKLYMYDVNALEGHHLKLISVDGEPNDYGGNDLAEAVVGMDDNANYIYFVGRNDLLPNLPPYVGGIFDYRRLYVWHNGTVHYVVTHQDDQEFSQFYGWGTEALPYGDTFRVSTDGKTVAFMSSDPTTASRVGYDNRDPSGPCTYNSPYCYEVYTYNADSEELQCASCTFGVPAHSDATFVTIADTFKLPTQYLNHPLSEEGRYVFFDTRESLVPQDANGRSDVYEYNTVSKRAYLLSSGTCDCDAYFVDANPSGHDAFFTTHQQLVYADIDAAADLYDARIEGGIPAQNRPPAVACSGEECQGPVPSPPVFSLPASSTFSGIGNPQAAVSKPAVKRAKHKQSRRHKRRNKRRKSNKHASHRTGR